MSFMTLVCYLISNLMGSPGTLVDGGPKEAMLMTTDLDRGTGR